MANKMISLKSSNGDIFEIEETAAKQSNLIRLMIEDGCANDVIPLQKVDSNILVKIMDYCKRHAAAAEDSRPSSELDLNQSYSSISNSNFTVTSMAGDGDELQILDGNFPQVDWDSLAKKFAEDSWLSYDSDLNQPSFVTSTSSPKVEDDLQLFDKKFVEVDWDTLVRIIIAANYLDIQSLLDLTNQAAADYIKNMSYEEIYKVFNIKKDFTPEEEAEICRENPWAFI